MTPPRAWLYLRGIDSVRIVLDGGSIAIHGPGPRVRRVQFANEMDAVLYQISVERSLLVGGWILEGLDSGAGARRRAARPGG